jgi:DNA-binding Lrp family transcriptional regulator
MDLDDTDRAILYLLQERTRWETSVADIADLVGVSSSTVSNRLSRLKGAGVLADLRPEIDYEEAAVPHHHLLVCTAPVADRAALAEEAVDVPGVVTVYELLAGTGNLLVEVVSPTPTGVARAAEALDALALDVEESKLVRGAHTTPLEYFGRSLSD